MNELLPSAYRVTKLATEAIAGAHMQVVHLLQDAEISVSGAGVDPLEAAVAFRSERYLRCNGKVPGDAWALLSGDYRARDGRWIRLHANFPHHEAAVLRVLGVRRDRAAVTGAVSNAWDAFALEAAVLDAGGAAAAERTADEWAALGHPARPLIAVERIADADARPLRIDAERPLRHLRVLDMTRVIAGPVAGRTLAAYGADVLRIGAARLPVSGDIEVMDTGFGKRFAELDITKPDERERLLDLARDADFVVQSFRQGALDRYGLGAEDFARVSPGIVYVSLTAYGAGPWHARRGFDSLVQMATGITRTAAVLAKREAPLPLPAQALDHATGWYAATGALTALRRQRREGGSWRVDVALARTAEYLKSYGTADALGMHDPTFDDVRHLLRETDSPFGRITHARFPGMIDALNLQWRTPPHRQGADSAAWL